MSLNLEFQISITHFYAVFAIYVCILYDDDIISWFYIDLKKFSLFIFSLSLRFILYINLIIYPNLFSTLIIITSYDSYLI